MRNLNLLKVVTDDASVSLAALASLSHRSCHQLK